MLLRIAGINHFDVLGRDKLEQWFANFAAERPGPSFLATAWDPIIFARVREQRTHLRQLAAERWPGFSDALLNVLALSLGYEADSHLMSYPNVNLLWLDQGREADQADIVHYADDRLPLYARFIGNRANIVNEDELLCTMSEAADEQAAGVRGVGERGQRFADRIHERAQNNNWAIIIVGKRHAADENVSMRRRLEQHGHMCQISLL